MAEARDRLRLIVSQNSATHEANFKSHFSDSSKNKKQKSLVKVKFPSEKWKWWLQQDF